jgi:hypothetical protein
MVLNPIFLGGVWFIIHRYSVFHHHKHRGICWLLSLVKTCLIHYSIVLNLTTVNVPRIENIILFNLQKNIVVGWFSAVTFEKKNRTLRFVNKSL